MAASPGGGRGGPSWRGRPWPCCRRARLENGIDRLTLRFVDPMKEDGFARTHEAQLSHYVALIMAALAAVSLLNLAAHRFWDASQYPTEEAQELSKWQMVIHIGLLVSLVLALGSGRLLAKYKIISTLGLEIIVVSASTCAMIVLVVIPKHYMARVFGYGDTEAIWGVDLGPTDCNLVLYIDLVVTSLHLLLPIRWMVLVPLEVLAVLAYIVPALLLGSPAMNQVPFNITGLLALTVLSAVGKRAFERQERALFAGLLSEKQMRFQAEFQLSRVDNRGEAAKEKDNGSERSAALSRPGTTMSAAAFDGSVEHSSFDQIRAIGQREQWLIASGEVELLTDVVLGRGGFGLVVMGLYHSTLVAVKAPREDVARNGAICSCLPELCNELRILRRIRHPNIAFLYGACMDADLRKLCLVLEFVDGVPLGAFIRRLPQCPDAPLEPRPGGLAGGVCARSALIFDILNALRYLHSRQPVVVHGDLKDSNVFVEERRSSSGRSWHHAKLLDFGLSRIATRGAKPLGGTLRWMAPELLSRQAVPPDTAADCYSFGLVMYFIVTGCLPFEREHNEQVLKQLRRGQPPSLAWPAPADDLARACRPVVEQCTQPKPALRPPAQQVTDELSAALGRAMGGAAEEVTDELSAALSRAMGGAAEEAAEALAARGPAAAQELPEFSGVVEARRTGGASVGSLVSSRGSRSLPPVQEHEVLLSGEAPGGSAAAPPTTAGSAQWRLAHPEYGPTPLSTQTLGLAYLLLQWNAPVPGSACCWLHGALRSLDRVRGEIERGPCCVPPGSTFCGQCGRCGLLMLHGQSSCEWCEATEEASDAACGRVSSEGTLSV